MFKKKFYYGDGTDNVVKMTKESAVYYVNEDLPILRPVKN